MPSIADIDDLFSRTINPIVFNDLLLTKTPDEIIEILCDISSSSNDYVATCDCGELHANYYEGAICHVCGTVCTSNVNDEIKNDNWLEIPKSIKGVLNPQVFTILSGWMGNANGNRSILKQMLDMRLPNEQLNGTPFFTGMGFNWFYDNFDVIVRFFLDSHPNSGKRMNKSITMFLEKTGHCIWCHYLPILSKVIQPINKINKDIRYADSDMKNLMNAIFTLKSVLLSERTMKFNVDSVEKNFFKVYFEFIEYYGVILRNKLPQKPSILRKHIFGSRSHCSGRSVAIPITIPHEYDDIHLPWKIGIMMYKYHILSILINRYRYTVFNAYNKITSAINIYDFDIDQIMQLLIKECRFKGLPILVNRNPSLKISNIELMWVTKIKPSLSENLQQHHDHDSSNIIIDTSSNILDVICDKYHDSYQINNIDNILQRYIDDATIAVSPLIVKGFNLDFDGDEINLLPLFEMDEVCNFERLHPAHRFISSNELKIVGGDIVVSNQQLCMLNNWLEDDED